MNVCSIGKKLNDICHKTSKSRKVGFINLNKLLNDERETLVLRAGLDIIQLTTVCLHHEKVFGSSFEAKKDKCCD